MLFGIEENIQAFNTANGYLSHKSRANSTTTAIISEQKRNMAVQLNLASKENKMLNGTFPLSFLTVLFLLFPPVFPHPVFYSPVVSIQGKISFVFILLI